MRVWFNKTFSSVHAAIELIRAADTGNRFHITHSNPNPYSPAGRAAHAFVVEPVGLDDDAYLAWCLAFCREQRIDIFIPGKGATMLADMHDRFAAIGTRVASVAAHAALSTIHDKARFYAEAKLGCAPVADFFPFHTLDQFDAAHARLRPRHARLCIKPSHSVFGLGFAILDEARSSAALLIAGVQYHTGLQDFRRGLQELGTVRTMLLMAYLDGHEYSVDCVGDNGRLVAAVVRKKSTQAGHGQLIDMRADILAASAELAGMYRLSGMFNIQFREGAGALRLLEINPRMSGGIGMACMAGPNLPYIALCGLADGFDNVFVPPVRNGIRVTELASAAELA